ncbi:hypothetical protein SESBI_04607 [Sesbania bispinosa]|nr:hypothetical protein SESBI_04607 [Sesbania bispinosa]
MVGSSKSSSASRFSRKRCGCGDEVVVFTAGSRAKSPEKRFEGALTGRFEFGDGYWETQDVNSGGLFELVEEDDRLEGCVGGGCLQLIKNIDRNS